MVLRIFRDDLKRLMKSFFAIVIVIGVLFLSPLYAWANIYSNWDPYGSTANLKMAAVSLDEGYTDDEGVYHNAGQEIIDNLHENDKIDWQFVKTKKQAVDGVDRGDYYGAVVITKDFSYNMYNIFQEDINKPQMQFYQNQKKNPVANKITDTVVETLKNNINESFVKVMTTTVFKGTNEVTKDIQEEGGLDGIIEKLQAMHDSINSYETLIDVATTGNATLTSALSKAGTDVDDMQQTAQDASDSLAGAATGLESTQQSMNNFTSQVNSTMDVVQSTLDNISATLNQDTIKNDNDAMYAAAKTAYHDTETVMDQLNALDKTVLNDKIKDLTGVDLNAEDAQQTVDTLKGNLTDAQKELIDQILQDPNLSQTEKEEIEKAQEKLEQDSTKADTVVNDIASGVLKDTADQAADNAKAKLDQDAAEAKQNAINRMNKAASDIQSAQDQYNNNFKPQMTSIVSGLTETINNASDAMQTMSNTLAGMGDVFGALQLTVDAGTDSLQNTKTALILMDNRISTALDKVKAAKEDDRVQVLIDTLTGDPDRYGEFFAEPVKIKSEVIYPVENYGSAVTPFYTSLALWVGGILLVAILKVKPTKSKYPDAQPRQLFFGRFMLFGVLSFISGTITVLGDLYLLKVQCLYPFRFWLACVIASEIFTLFIYALVYSFGDVGKAAAVVIVVLQIAGSSGTYPIELLPSFFRRVYRFFPFPYAINAMRECIAGMYHYDYVIYLLELSVFILVALTIGILIQKPFHGINHFMEKRMEDTEIM